ncbi:MAG: hypothetical protein GQ570_09575 [Helicobacteraceae bacterium]|nr:hypothetical protein [Helicobacteraceae bacterium]
MKKIIIILFALVCFANEKRVFLLPEESYSSVNFIENKIILTKSNIKIIINDLNIYAIKKELIKSIKKGVKVIAISNEKNIANLDNNLLNLLQYKNFELYLLRSHKLIAKNIFIFDDNISCSSTRTFNKNIYKNIKGVVECNACSKKSIELFNTQLLKSKQYLE